MEFWQWEPWVRHWGFNGYPLGILTLAVFLKAAKVEFEFIT